MFEQGISGNEASHSLGKHNFGPVLGGDIVGRVNHPESAALFGSFNNQSVGHTVVGAAKGDVGSFGCRLFAKASFEFFFESCGDRDDRDLDRFQKMAFFVSGTLEF
ncbi:MAG: hypothetical protein UX38_C0004G0034 [Microgenomates group bacterium GW2011_GWC1_46_16]|nr:MAG: hypothetical protein UX38_C0004G0034 [Microgenomates group bacterium GW2011_GWC1_46_16]